MPYMPRGTTEPKIARMPNPIDSSRLGNTRKFFMRPRRIR
jgi:hypothetical protein